MQGSQIDITLSTTTAALGELIRHVRRGDVAAAYSLRRGAAEALEIVAHGDAEAPRSSAGASAASRCPKAAPSEP